jgi:uncharacterized protein
VRGCLVAVRVAGDLYALGWADVLPGEAGHELLGARTLRLALRLTPAMLAGIWVGQRVFAGVSPQRFRRGVLNLLMLIAGLSVLRAMVVLLG